MISAVQQLRSLATASPAASATCAADPEDAPLVRCIIECLLSTGGTAVIGDLGDRVTRTHPRATYARVVPFTELNVRRLRLRPFLQLYPHIFSVPDNQLLPVVLIRDTSVESTAETSDA